MEAVGSLLEAAGLPPLPPSTSLSNTLVALEKGSVIGVVALEVMGRSGLTCWVAVSPEHQGKGLGASLMRSLCARAQELGLRELVAVTAGASSFFMKLGFSPLPRGALPSEARSMKAYSGYADDSTEVLGLELQTRI
jgi:N-acetylglutamate synthase-like GNAT family acetyltransferase